MKPNALLALVATLVVVIFLSATGVLGGNVCLKNVGCAAANDQGIQVESWRTAGARMP